MNVNLGSKWTVQNADVKKKKVGRPMKEIKEIDVVMVVSLIIFSIGIIALCR